MNWIAILVAAVLNMLIGFLWYSNLMFSKPWVKAMGMHMGDMKKEGVNQKYGMMVVASIIIAYVLSWFVHMLNIHSAMDGVKLGFLAWLGFATTAQFANWAFSGKPKELYIINTGYQLVAYMIMGALLAVWR